jgi:hypothetical protein
MSGSGRREAVCRPLGLELNIYECWRIGDSDPLIPFLFPCILSGAHPISDWYQIKVMMLGIMTLMLGVHST